VAKSSSASRVPWTQFEDVPAAEGLLFGNDLTQNLCGGSVDGPGDVFDEYTRQDSHTTTSTIAATTTATISSPSFDQYGQQNYFEDQSAPALNFAYMQVEDGSLLDTLPASNSAATSASVDTVGGESCEIASHKQSGTPEANYGSPPPVTLQKDYSHRSALHIAVSQGNIRMVKLLLDRDADVGLLNKDGQTPLHLAVSATAESGKRYGGSSSVEFKEAEKTIRLLMQAGADIHATDDSGRSVLVTAVATGSEAVVQMVLDIMACEGLEDNSSNSNCSSKVLGSDVRHESIQAALNKPDAEGTLPLHMAVASGSASMVLLLLSNGADING
jgi:ankyrin repeat protein